MSSSTLQDSLLIRPPLFSSSLRFHPQSLSTFYRLSFVLLHSRFRPLPCSLRHDNVASDSEFLPKDPAFVLSDSGSGDSDAEITNSVENGLVSDKEVNELGISEVTSEASFAADAKSGGEEAEDKKENEKKSKFRIVVLLMGLWSAINRAMEKVMEWEWLSWWPFSRQEKRLEKLIAEADANPKDAVLQGALLAELNKHVLMGAAALQKYIGSLGAIGTSGVGSSSSYSPKEMNKEITPEKNVKTFKDVKGCDDAKQELEEVVEYLKNPSKFTRHGSPH